MDSIFKIFDFILSAFSSVWTALKALYDAFTAIFEQLSSFFSSVFDKLGIYDTICSSLDTLTNLFNTISSYIDTGHGISQAILSFLALDTLTTVVVTVSSATFGVILVVLSLVFVTVIPLLLGWLAVKGVLRLIRLVSAGFVDA